MERKFIYEVDGFTPRLDSDARGGYGFSISLDKEFAQKALETKMPEGNRLENIAKSILKKQFGDRLMMPPYHFVEDTCLLQYCQVPGEACTIGMSWDEVERLKSDSLSWIEYHPHNVDSTNQAYTLLSIWTMWVDLMKSYLDVDKF